MIEIIATICGLVFGVIGTSLSLRNHIRQLKQDFDRRLSEEMDRQSDAKVKAYAAERDFQHLRGHHEQLKISVADLQDETEEMRKTLIELQVISRGAFNRMELLAARLEGGGNTSGSGNMTRL
jgi:predicted RNase H-like nuclease (RuvC/YqgF family)